MKQLTMTLTALLLALAMGTGSLVLAGDGAIGRGEFRGASNHVTSGEVIIRKTADGYVVELGADFSLDGAPDPKLGFGKDGYDASTTFAKLESNTGAQVYQVPAGIDVEAYNEFYIWCEKFSVPLGIARLR